MIKGIGVQLTKTLRKGSASHVFIDATRIRDVVINEEGCMQGMTPYSVYFYVALIISDSDKMTVPFEITDSSRLQSYQF